jgi:methylamine---glutamate N-methyltransferase subunit B
MQEQTLLKTVEIDCANLSTRQINQKLKTLSTEGFQSIRLINPDGRHNLAVGIEGAIAIEIDGAVGYYCGGLSDGVNLDISGNCGWSVGENLMAGTITVRGNASSNAAASAHGGKICVLGNAGPRAGISLKGATLIVTGNIGYSSGFMMQAGCLIACGNAGENLADSIYEGTIYIGGEIASLGADAILETLTDTDWQKLTQELTPLNINPRDYKFKKVICAKELYHFKAKNWSKWKDAY